jgi:PAS domain S-box-containing protein
MSTKPTYEELEQRVQELEQTVSERKKMEELRWQQKQFFPLLVNYSSDITERMGSMEKALQKSEERFGFLAENQHDVVWILNENLEVDYISPSCFKMTGTTAEETMGMNLKDFLTDESHQRILMKLSEERQKAPNEMQPVVVEVVQYHKDEHFFPVEITCMPIIIDHKFIGVQGISRDITEKNKAEKEIGRLSIAVEQSPSTITITDLNGNLTYVNPKFTELTGYTSEEALHVNPRILKSGEQPDEMYKELWKTISSGKIWRGEFHNKRKNGELFWEAASVSPLFNKQGEIINYIKVAENITERKEAEEAVRESEEKYRSLVEATSDWIWEVDNNGVYRYSNSKIKDILGYEPEEIIGKTPFDFMAPNEQERLTEWFRDILEFPKSFEGMENTNIHKDGGHVLLETSGVPIFDTDGNLLGFRGIDRNITRRMLAEDALRESEKKYRILFEDSPISLWEEDFSALKTYIDGLRDRGVNNFRTFFEAHPEDLAHCATMVKIVDVNKTTLDMYQIERKKEFLKGLDLFLTEESYGLLKEGIISLCEGKLSFEGEVSNQTARGEIKHIYMKSFLASGYEGTWSKVLVSIIDITDRKQAEEQIKQNLKEKEILLSEIHHRVKNNMQVISSLLKLQSAKIEDKKYLDMFKDSENRIKSMALVHEKLYQSKDFASIDFNGYVKSIANPLIRNHTVNPDRIKLNIEIEDVPLELDNAIPCGLIINELISNSLKYAFPKDREGGIDIVLKAINSDEIELTVSDDGIGIPAEIDIGKTESLGLQLVQILAENQLDGTLELNRDGGTAFKIRFEN